MKLLGRERPALALGTLAIFLLSAVPLCAQDTPVGPEGTQVATQATPAAAANTDALRNAAQNPVASLISVPFRKTSILASGPPIAPRMFSTFNQ